MNKSIYDFLMNSGYINPKSERYVCLPEMIFFSPEKINYYNSDRYDYLKTQDLFLFAKNISGDFFAWNKNNETVIFCDQGSGYGFVFAENLEGAIFRRIIEFANGDYNELCTDEEKAKMDGEEQEDYICETEAIDMLKEYKNCFSDFFKNEWIQIIDNMIKNGFLDMNSFLTESETMEIIRNKLSCKNVNKKIDLNYR